jgi:hypothetical protein
VNDASTSPCHPRGEIRWAPRVPQSDIRRLYQSEAEGRLEETLLADVALTLYLRCLDILAVDEAQHGRVRCARCHNAGRQTMILRPPRQVHGADARDALLTCPVCGWSVTWGEFYVAVKRRQLNIGGAGAFFTTYVRDYEAGPAPKALMLAVDRLIHAFHYSLLADPNLPTRAAGVNLIEGNLTSVLALLDGLTFGEALPPELEATRTAWRSTQKRVERWYAEVAARRGEAPDAGDGL